MTPREAGYVEDTTTVRSDWVSAAAADGKPARLQAAPGPGRSKRLEKSTILGVLLAVSCVVLGCYLEGESLGLLLQPTALAVVVMGTTSVVLIQFPIAVLREAFRQAFWLFRSHAHGSETLAQDLLRYAKQAQTSSLLSLDGELDRIRDPFLRKALTLAVDGAQEAEIRSTMQLETNAREHIADLVDQLLETAAAVAPPLGILGAVLGLLHVMQLLNDFDQVGRGIAAAFVSTLYGVGLSNLFLLPIAGNLRLRERELRRRQEMLLEGVLGIVARTRPRSLEAKLGSYTLRTSVRPGRSVLAG